MTFLADKFFLAPIVMLVYVFDSVYEMYFQNNFLSVVDDPLLVVYIFLTLVYVSYSVSL